jgi:hypothetical protein
LPGLLFPDSDSLARDQGATAIPEAGPRAERTGMEQGC